MDEVHQKHPNLQPFGDLSKAEQEPQLLAARTAIRHLDDMGFQLGRQVCGCVVCACVGMYWHVVCRVSSVCMSVGVSFCVGLSPPRCEALWTACVRLGD